LLPVRQHKTAGKEVYSIYIEKDEECQARPKREEEEEEGFVAGACGTIIPDSSPQSRSEERHKQTANMPSAKGIKNAKSAKGRNIGTALSCVV
jgi:hypothetical protein